MFSFCAPAISASISEASVGEVLRILRPSQPENGLNAMAAPAATPPWTMRRRSNDFWSRLIIATLLRRARHALYSKPDCVLRTIPSFTSFRKTWLTRCQSTIFPTSRLQTLTGTELRTRSDWSTLCARHGHGRGRARRVDPAARSNSASVIPCSPMVWYLAGPPMRKMRSTGEQRRRSRSPGSTTRS